MQLPKSNGLPVNLLAACFNNTVATYKYYWLLSILQKVETGDLLISKRHLFARVISNAWFTVNYFRVSFGNPDLIQNTILNIRQCEKIPIDEKLHSVSKKLLTTVTHSTERGLWHFDKNVPHWFSSPWFPGSDRKDIYAASIKFDRQCLYALHDHKIEVNPEWNEYLKENARVLKGFCYWNLSFC